VDRRQDRPVPRRGAEAGNQLDELRADQRRRTLYAPYWFMKNRGRTRWAKARSPFSLVGNVKTPTLVVVGSGLSHPDSEAEQYYEALQLRGNPDRVRQVPGASHGGIAARPSQAAAKRRRSSLVRALPHEQWFRQPMPIPELQGSAH
jgi:acetyl esterase/lipase